MTISEYEVFGVVPDWRDRFRILNEQIRQQLTIMEHSHGSQFEPSVPRTMMARWDVEAFEKTGDKEHLIKAMAWLTAEWAG